MSFWKARRALRRTERVLGDVDAARRGRLGRRIVRRKAYRTLFR
jgi:hypothetical protein